MAILELAAEPSLARRESYELVDTYAPGQGREVRRISAALLALWGVAELAEDFSVIASELCSNARHVAGTFRLTISHRPGVVRIEMQDSSPVIPSIPREMPAWDAVGGRGLYLVGQYSDAMGVDPIAGGKVIWAECALKGMETANGRSPHSSCS